MDAALKKSGLTFIIVGLVCMPLGPIAGGLFESDRIRSSGSLATSLGAAIFTFGCIRIALAKGQPWFYGLLGLLNCLGLAVLWFAVPDKNVPTPK